MVTQPDTAPRTVPEQPSAAQMRWIEEVEREPWITILREVDAEIEPDLSNLPAVLGRVPLAIWAAALLRPQTFFPRSHPHLPVMASAHVQMKYNAGHGAALLLRSVDFVKQTATWLGSCGVNVATSRGMDFGVGWGRLARLWLKYATPNALVGADAWKPSLDEARRCNLKNPLLHTDAVLAAAPAESLDFVWACSVFTHLDREAFEACLLHLGRSLRPGGALVFSVRPHEFMGRIGKQVPAPDEPFVYYTHPSGAVHFGNTSVSPAWVAAECLRAGLEAPLLEWSPRDPYQVLVLTRRPQ
jgi:SAM-dependent methyltransferase